RCRTIGFNGSEEKPTAAYWITFFLLDSKNRPRKTRRLFAAVPRLEGTSDLLLSQASMGREGIVINTRTNTWEYDRISLADPEQILQEVVENHERAYVA
ncbi:hypothetical protein LY78DRAFT_52073, partial [Colletotrichum sublineola]